VSRLETQEGSLSPVGLELTVFLLLGRRGLAQGGWCEGWVDGG
jgi:hypothetical protein